VAMHDQRQAIDVITLQSWLKDNQELEQVGGIAYLAGLPDTVPSAANLSYYLEIVMEKYILRKAIHTCTAIVGRVYDYEGEVDEMLDELEKDVLAIRRNSKKNEQQDIKQLVSKAINQIEELHQNQGKLTGVSTGFSDFDRMTTGLHGGEMIVIAARPSMGKTSLAMQIATHVAIEQKFPVGVFSLEMTADSLVMRMLCSEARVNIRNVKEGFLSDRDFPKITAASGRIHNANLFIDDTSGLSIMQLRAKARALHQQHGIKLFVIDYMQLLHTTNKRAENRQQEIADISGGIKALAKELNVPIIVLSQLNRELEKRGAGQRPKMADLRESGAIEQDADVIGLLYKPGKPGSNVEEYEEEHSEAIAVDLVIAKQRNGPTGDIHFTFLKSFTRFETAARVSDDDVPIKSRRSGDD
jgi:replicative DNA helicase